MADQRLFGTQMEALQKALMSAFYNRDELDQFLAFRLDRSLEEVAAAGPLPKVTLAVIRAAEGEGWTDALVRKAYEYRPGNPDLRRFYETYTGSVQRELESVVKAKGLDLQRMVTAFDFVDARAWRERLQEIEARVCRIDVFNAQTPLGTGFLVAPDVVMTNHHVLAKVIDGIWNPGEVIVRFDHHQFLDGGLSKGTEHRLHAADWLLASSPPSPLDTQADPAGEPSPEHLDYALVRLASPAGKDAVDGRERGFVPFRAGAVELRPDTGLVIVQHPSGRPMKLAIDPSAAVVVNGNKTRVRYRTNTEKGSSGAPCFTMGWELAVLHHSGDPEKNERARYNEGVPLDTIRERLPDAVRTALGW